MLFVGKIMDFEGKKRFKRGEYALKRENMH
jgi:hypothetical protein